MTGEGLGGGTSAGLTEMMEVMSSGLSVQCGCQLIFILHSQLGLSVNVIVDFSPVNNLVNKAEVSPSTIIAQRLTYWGSRQLP